MRKYLWLLLLILLPVISQARGLVVVPTPAPATNANLGVKVQEDIVTNCLINRNAQYDLIRGNWIDSPEAMMALRAGKFSWNRKDTTTYDMVIVPGHRQGIYTSAVANCSVTNQYIRTTTANGFQFVNTGDVITGTGVSSGTYVGAIDSLNCRATVVGPGGNGATITLTWARNFRPDLMTLNGFYPKVLWVLFGNHNEGGSFLTTSSSSGPESTGVGVTAQYNSYDDSTHAYYLLADPGIHWQPLNGGGRCVALTGTTNNRRDARGFRPLIGNITTRVQNTPTHLAGVYDNPYPGGWTYSDGVVQTGAVWPLNPDTVTAWMIMNYAAGTSTPLRTSDQATAKPFLCVQPASFYNSFGCDPTIIQYGLSLADSFTNGGLYGASPKPPIKMSFHIDDGFKSGDARSGKAYGGADPNDFDTMWASRDSFIALGRLYPNRTRPTGIPAVLGVELDSVWYFNDHKAKWMQWSSLKFTPHCHKGTTTNNTGVSNNSTPYVSMADIWGTNRVRVIYNPPGWSVTDTCWFNLQTRAFFMSDSIFGKSRVDHFAMPPGDDWSPSGNSPWSYIQMDTVMAYWPQLGGKGIRSNVYTYTAQMANMPSNPLGMSVGYTPFKWGIKFGALQGSYVPIFSCFGYPQNGSKPSMYSASSANLTMVPNYQQKAVYSTLIGRNEINVNQSHSTKGTYVPVTNISNVVAIHTSDLQNNGDATNPWPTRPGYYHFKNAFMPTLAINSVARTPVFRWVYPEELDTVE